MKIGLPATLALLLWNPAAGLSSEKTSESSARNDFMAVKPIQSVRKFQDVRFKDLSGIDFSDKSDVPATLWFNQRTVWPRSLPPDSDPAKILKQGMNPGLGVRKLHEEGLTGKGVSVAIIDQPLYQDHPEFVGKIANYYDVDCGSDSSMHGPAVASLLVGSQCGTAPGARLYFVAAPSWTGDSASQAKALDWIVEQNAKLPPPEKIRVVSVSAAPSGPGSPFKKNLEAWDKACANAEKAGLLVLDCTEHHGFVGPCYYDRINADDVAKCQPGFPSMPGRMGKPARAMVLAPCSSRTTAEEYTKGDHGYQYTGQGGLSWSIPYCAGVLALGWQVRPELKASEIRELLFQSAHKTSDGWLVINPPEFIKLIKASATGSAAR